jgi:tetratricopeptide (TPR) repeat protein
MSDETGAKSGETASRAKPRKSRRRVTGKSARTARTSEIPREEIASAPPVIAEIAKEAESFDHALHERRAKLAKYVKVAVGLSAALCLVAGVRGAIAHARRDADAMTRAVVVDIAHAATRSEPRAEVTPEPSPPPSPAPMESAAAVASTSDTPVKSAADEKKDARAALERGKLREAIAAAERAVTLDPTDADAWLVLGAAYQDSGRGIDARRAFKACKEQSTRGSIRECSLMLQ